MMSPRTGLQKLTNGPTRRQVIAGIAMAFGGLSLGSTEAWAQANGISHAAESIHQEVDFKASRKRIYEALTDATQFEHVVKLSDAMKTRMPPGAPPTEISPEAGGAVSTFWGLVEGMQMQPGPHEEG